MKLDCTLFSYTKVNSKWIKHLNIRPETINHIEENIGTKLMDLGLSEYFVNFIPRIRKVQAKITEWDYIKLKSFCTARETDEKTKRPPTKREKTFTDNSFHKGLISK